MNAGIDDGEHIGLPKQGEKMKADLIIKGKALFDSVSTEPFSGYVAIGGNKIIEVKKGYDGIDEFTGPETMVYDAGERLVMPGFHDSHTHLVLGGLCANNANLGEAKSEEEAAKMVWEHYNKSDSKGRWVYGFNWYHVFWDNHELPTKASLDKYFPDKPVMLLNSEAHGAWVNTKAMEIAGITRDTKDPVGGEIAKDENGEPTGFLYETAMELVVPYAYDFTDDEEKERLKAFMENAKTLGITSLVDVRPYFGRNLGRPRIYKELEDAGELTLRICTAADMLGDLEEAKKDREMYDTEKVKCHMLKQFIDGVVTTHTAWMKEEYTDAPGNVGEPLSEPEKLYEGIQRGHEAGFWIKLHAIGDRAIEFAVDSIEDAMDKYGDRGNRHALEHIETPKEKDVERMGRLNIVASVQPEHLGLMPTWEGEEYRTVLGEERAGKTWPFRDMLDAGSMLALGSDCPVVSNDPLFALHRGVTRVHDDGLPEGGWNPSQKLSVAEVIKYYTAGSAYGVGREDELGTLEKGKLADVIVLDMDPFREDPDRIRKGKVDLTVMDGNIIYER